MIVAKDDTEHDDELSFQTIERIERLIATCTGDKEKYYAILNRLDNESEAQQLIDELTEIQQIPGYHCTPHGPKEIKRAVDYMIEKDDYYERLQRKGKSD